MKRFLSILLFLIILFTNNLISQIVVTGSHTSSNGAYSNLNSAFKKINTYDQSGNNIIITINADITEPAWGDTLNSGNWTSLKVIPNGNRTINGTVTLAGKSSIRLNGADNVTIDGLNDGSNSLTLNNSYNTASAGGSPVILFINDASNNTIKNCTIKGSSFNANSGVIFFSTGTVTGNDNNTIENCQITTSGTRQLISIYSEGTVSKENSGNIIKNNTFYNCFKNSGATYGIKIFSNSTNFSIIGNSFYEPNTTSTNAGTYLIAIDNTSGNNFIVKDNIFGGNATNNTGTWTRTTGNNNFYGIYLNVGNSTVSEIDNNTFKNFSYTVDLTGNFHCINIVSGLVKVGSNNSNTFNNINFNSAGGSFYAIKNAGNTTIAKNEIKDISTSISSNTTNLIGINNSGNATVYQNNINNFTASTTGTSTIKGIEVNGGTSSYYNNMIALGNSLSNSFLINGIDENSGTNNFYFNSIYIGGSSVDGSNNTFALKSTVTSNTRNYKNNIFYNSRSNGTGTGKHYAISYGGTTQNPTGLATDFNIYYTSGTGGVLAYYNSSDVTTLQALRYYVGQDLHSTFANPNFVDASASSPNLHLNPTNPAESSGIVISNITSDFDGNSRTNDIGADAGNFTLDDKFTPNFNFTLLQGGAANTTRTLKVTITDIGEGINTSDDYKPRIWYKKNLGGSWNYAKGDLLTGNNNNGEWLFTIANLSQVEGDRIYYFIVAQDNASTFNIWTSCFDATTPNMTNVASASPPPDNSVLHYYDIIPSFLSSTVTVGNSGCDYSSLKVLFDDISNKCIPTDLNITVKSDLNESNISLLDNVVMNNHNSYIKISSDGSDRIISSTTNPTIKINNTENVIFEGDSKNLIFNNTSTNSVFQFSNGAKKCEINNCVIESNAGSTNGAINIGSGINTLSIFSNSIKDASGSLYTGIYSDNAQNLLSITNNEIYNWLNYGINLNNVADGCIINDNNFFYSLASASISTQESIRIWNGSGHTISNNYIGGNATNCSGTWINDGSFIFKGINIQVGNSSQTTIENNTIQNISLTSAFNPRFAGIQINTTTPNSNVKVKDNLIGSENTANSIMVAGSGSSYIYGIYSTSEEPNSLFESNTIANLTLNASTDGATISGIKIESGDVKKNKVYNLGRSSGTNYLNIDGLKFEVVTSSITNEVSNNMISLGGTNTLHRIYGINDANGNQNRNFIYNTVYLHGTAPASFNSKTIAMYKNNSTDKLHQNNIFINTISGGDGTQAHLAISAMSASFKSNYNLIVASDNTKALQYGPGSTYQNLTTWKTAGRDSNSWFAVANSTTDAENIIANNLFIDAANGDLRIDRTKAESWYVYGKAIAKDITTDINNNSRRTSYGYANCIGAYQFARPTQEPISATQTGTIAPGNTTTYFFGNRIICNLKWDASHVNTPTSIDVKLYSGTQPPKTDTNFIKLHNYFVNVNATGSGAYNYSIDLFYDYAFCGNLIKNNDALLSKISYVDSSWTSYTSTISNIGGNQYKLSASGLTSFSGFTSSEKSTALPIELITFEGKCNNNNAILTWNTASELNNDHFTIEKLSNNKTWSKIGVIKGLGNSSIINNYKFIDNNYDGDVVYYRLSQTDFNGSTTYFNPIQVSCSNNIEDETTIGIYPNPVKDKFNISIFSNDKSPFNVSIYDFNGAKVLELKNILLNDNQFTNDFDISFLPKGIYLLKIIGNNVDESKKIIKE